MMLKFAKRFIIKILCIAQVLDPCLILAMEVSQSTNLISREKVYRGFVTTGEKMPLDFHEIKVDAQSGAYHLSLDPAIGKEDFSLWLTDNENIVASLAFSQGVLVFKNLQEGKFKLSLPPLEEGEAFLAQVEGTLSLEGECTRGQVEATTLEIGKLKVKKDLRITNTGEFLINGDLQANEIFSQAHAFQNYGILKCHQGVFQFHTGKTSTGSYMEGNRLLAFQGFESFEQSGGIVSRGFLSREGKTYKSLLGSWSFAGALHQLHLGKWLDEGTTYAFQQESTVKYPVQLEKSYEFLGESFLLKALDDLHSEGSIKATTAICMTIDQHFSKGQGNLQIGGDKHGFISGGVRRIFDVLHKEGSLRDRQALVKGLRQDTENWRIEYRKSKVLVPLPSGIYVEAAGKATLHSGEITAEWGNAYLKGKELSIGRNNRFYLDSSTDQGTTLVSDTRLHYEGYLKGENASLLAGSTLDYLGKIKATETFLQAGELNLGGNIQGRVAGKADILTISGVMQGENLSFYGRVFTMLRDAFLRGEKGVVVRGDNLTLTGQIYGSLVALAEKQLTLEGKVEGAHHLLQGEEVNVTETALIKADKKVSTDKKASKEEKEPALSIVATENATVKGNLASEKSYVQGKNLNVGGTIKGNLTAVAEENLAFTANAEGTQHLLQGKNVEVKQSAILKADKKVSTDKKASEEEKEPGLSIVAVKTAILDGQLTAEGTYVKGKDLHVKGNLHGEKWVALTAEKTAIISGTLDTHLLEATAPAFQISNSGEVRAENATVEACTLYDVKGRFEAQKDIFLQLGTTYNLKNTLAHGWLRLERDTFDDISGLIAGRYCDLSQSEGIQLKTNQDVLLDTHLSVNWGIGVIAPSIHVIKALAASGDIALCATKNDLVIGESWVAAPDLLPVHPSTMEFLKGRNIYLSSAKNLPIYSAINAGKELSLTANHLVEFYGRLEADDIKVKAGGFKGERIVGSRSIHGGYQEYLRNHPWMQARRGDILVDVEGGIQSLGVHFDATGQVKLLSNNNIYLGCQRVSFEQSIHEKKGGFDTYILTHYGTTINAGALIQIQAAQDLVFEKVAFTSQTHNILSKAGGKLENKAVQDIYDHQSWKKKRRGGIRRAFGHKKVVRHHHVNALAQGNVFEAKDLIQFKAKKDNYQYAPILKAKRVEILSEEEKVWMKAIQSFTLVESQKSSKDLVWQCMSQGGSYHEYLEHARIYAQEICFNAPKGVEVEFCRGIEVEETKGQKKNAYIRQAATAYEALSTLAQQPGLGWMAQVYGQEKTTFHELYEKHVHWACKMKGPGPVTTIAIAIVMTCLTGGGALGAAVASLLTQFSTNMLSNGGNIGKSLKKIDLKQVAVAAVTAAATQYVCQAYNIAAPSVLDKVGTPSATGASSVGSNGLKYLQYLKYNSVNVGVSTGVRIAMDPHKIGKQLLQGLGMIGVQTGANIIASNIGEWRSAHFAPSGNDNTWANYVMHKGFHGIAGYVGGVGTGAILGLKGSELQKAGLGGALGAITAEVIGESFREEIQQRTAQRYIAEGNNRYQIDQRALERILNDEMKLVRCLAELGAVGVAGAFNCNPSMASSAAVNAIDNNLVAVLAAPFVASEVAAFVAGLGIGTMGGIVVAEGIKYVTNYLSSSPSDGYAMDAADPSIGWVDDGFTTEEGKVQIISTPIPSENEVRLQLPGFAPVPEDIRFTLEGFSVYDGPDTRILESERKVNCGKGESLVWRSFKPYKGAVKTNGLSGKKARYYEWDYTHNDIEVYDGKREHLGSMDPLTGKMYKKAVRGREK